MNEHNAHKPPVWFYIIGGVALLWNLMGMMAFAMQAMLNEQALTQAVTDGAMTQELADVYRNIPGWLNIVYGAAVVCGVLGCIALILRSKFCLPLFVISLIAVIIQNGYNWATIDVNKHFGVVGFVMPGLIIAIGAALIWFSLSSAKKGWVK